jgi:hypothetical protein
MTHLEDRIIHEDLVDEVFRRLVETGRYTSIQKHVFYHVKKLAGECDLIASNDRFINYYEIKCRKCPQSHARAREQFSRFRQSHPLLIPRFIYVTPTTVKREYI